jgi:hypothetical protein
MDNAADEQYLAYFSKTLKAPLPYVDSPGFLRCFMSLFQLIQFFSPGQGVLGKHF